LSRVFAARSRQCWGSRTSAVVAISVLALLFFEGQRFGSAKAAYKS
jgi:hypothetical protein